MVDNALRHKLSGGYIQSVANQIYLSLGSNLGHRQQNLQHAIDALGEVMAVEAISSIYVTAPWGFTEQPDFLNICIAGKTVLEPSQFLATSKLIEEQVGREPSRHWGPRLIDIDLLYYEDIVLSDGHLTVPHPGIIDRAFVLIPLSEIAPDYVDPKLNLSVSQLAKSLGDASDQLSRDETRKLHRPVHLAWGIKTYVMGIVNVTPDSFSGDGLLEQEQWLIGARDQAIKFVQEGADLIDIGGESTRPGSSPVSLEEELSRIAPVISTIRQAVDVPISIDTYRAPVAKAALEAGADWINDVWGLRMDENMASRAANSGCPIVLMHNRSKPKNVEQKSRLGGRYTGIRYDNLLIDIQQELLESVKLALESGVNENKIILDPGFGFGKSVEQNLELLDRLDQLKDMGFPLLVGTSRKSFIGYTLDLPPEDRLEGSAATVAIAIDRGTDIVRVHDVMEMARVAQMTDRIVRGSKNSKNMV